MAEKVEVRRAVKEDFRKLLSLDFTNTSDKFLNVDYRNNRITIGERRLAQPIVSASANYIKEIEGYLSKLDNPGEVAFLGYDGAEPVSYIYGYRETWPRGVVLSIDGILVAA